MAIANGKVAMDSTTMWYCRGVGRANADAPVFKPQPTGHGRWDPYGKSNSVRDR